MIDPLVIKQVRNAVCAIGYIRGSVDDFRQDATKPNYVIVGTGFLISNSIIITNGHVLKYLYRLEDDKKVAKENFLVSFVYPRIGAEPNWQWHFAGIVKSILPERDNCPDIGFIYFSKDKAPSDFSQCKPLDFSDLSEIHIGMHIAIWGYPAGTKLLQPNLGNYPDECLNRVGPVFHQGNISGGVPFEVEQNTSEFLLDIRTYNCMSGSPVFHPISGKVIGIHYKGNKTTTSFAIAQSKKDIEYWLTSLNICDIG